ncbi:hypothetical protein M7840_004573 [Salmonella enterica]|nr:hypothetical protein [Salmonella enterica]EJF1559530.1 hypothetical protein [Salmonella enterica]EJS4669322.1 hypothetical protein [Salmonella enterica]
MQRQSINSFLSIASIERKITGIYWRQCFIKDSPVEREIGFILYTIAVFFALQRIMILSAKYYANQCKKFRRATIPVDARGPLNAVDNHDDRAEEGKV